MHLILGYCYDISNYGLRAIFFKLISCISKISLFLHETLILLKIIMYVFGHIIT